MPVSMTGYATGRGSGAGATWVWELRSVNGKGFDLRHRLPEGIEGLEAALRAVLAPVVARGNVSLSLKMARDDAAATLTLNRANLAAALAALHAVEEAAMAAGVTLAQPTAADVLAVRGVVEGGNGEADTAPLRDAMVASFAPVVAAYQATRATEGAAVGTVIAGQIDQIAELVAEARRGNAGRTDRARAQMADALARLQAEGVDDARVAQEVALLAVRSDATEELDRLTIHIAAARALLTDTGPIGRKLDFLVQEFVREASTLCAKAGTSAMTKAGLAIKVVVDQMREQALNLE
jgi:uncharacterized protein (TIGR00255 family)